MAETLTDDHRDAVLAALAEWMPAQRWFAGKGTTPALRLIGSFDVDSTASETTQAADVRVATWLVLDAGGQQSKLYQVPLTFRSEALPALAASLVTTLTPTRLHVYDGAHDPAYAAALLDLITADAVTDPSHGVTASGRSQVAGHPLVTTGAKVLSGEQSNTSIIIRVEGPGGEPHTPVICKVFRVLHHGNNPDVVLQSALAKAGSMKVPASIGSVVGQWDDTRMPDGRTSGHLAFAQEFLPGVQDAWRVALDAVARDVAENGHSFIDAARALGEATAEIHQTLADVLPTLEPSPDLIAGVMASMRRRHGGAVREVPELAQYSAAIEKLFAAAEATPWPRLQRIHGDYHLGQVLALPNGGWVIVDFEGEPLRPMVERSQPDLALRDIAGMLRSFDYVAGSYGQSLAVASAESAQNDAVTAAAQWALDARAAFLDGYIARSGFDLHANHALLDAFEIDKALYEAIYEVRNRPTWLSIPTTAVARLAGDSGV
ncbi:maltokinase N-terminal cap-like domain-containing protein [Subtercola sp. RTI3]|uniref:maltokinase N-terminal cap-like domain-containing protein n=1 Tax=Subtercola sp. RTI3 TaxID=3048639 RepID=UPI002B231C76|nr:phosphotransferase [Subtercola sp. RTI3]MEA9985011.1 phosphotransferase [Subtercola sp. RTI3]